MRQPVIHRPVEMLGKLRDLAGRDQGADGDQTAIPGRKVGRSHSSRNRTSVVYCTTPRENGAELLLRRALRAASSPPRPAEGAIGEAGGS